MRQYGALLAAAAAFLILGACTGYPITDDSGRAGNYQTGAGLNVIEFDRLDCQPDLGLCGPRDFRMIGGKEQSNVSVALYTADGTKVLEYTADDVRAFEGQGFRAEVERVLAEQYGDVASSAIDAIVTAAKAAAGVP